MGDGTTPDKLPTPTPMDISEKSPAEQYKEAGNKLFKDGKYADAVLKYNDAIEADPEVPAFYTNRAFCHLKMENHGLAIADSTVAIELDKQFYKAYYRRGTAYMAASTRTRSRTSRPRVSSSRMTATRPRSSRPPRRR